MTKVIRRSKGGGKTTEIVKWAARHALEGRRICVVVPSANQQGVVRDTARSLGVYELLKSYMHVVSAGGRFDDSVLAVAIHASGRPIAVDNIDMFDSEIAERLRRRAELVTESEEPALPQQRDILFFESKADYEAQKHYADVRRADAALCRVGRNKWYVAQSKNSQVGRVVRIEVVD